MSNFYNQVCVCRHPLRSYTDRNRCYFCGGILLKQEIPDEVSETPTGKAVVGVLLCVIIALVLLFLGLAGACVQQANAHEEEVPYAEHLLLRYNDNCSEGE